ncbi:MAG TPA: DNA replication/repair protein RecF [Candidatus Pullilachnospira stercoravium]|uniref:DNA replication and repair protein RecF n=1 Tax=Candidatus Pullilachnospira stercoravium TaxID=2840913 RepID=A0A9D1NWY8_9FIRM|nr:DNA replication/repair protein RecF [Candidatus Pullilachnospira stercoravium]
MYIESIELKNYRNYEYLYIELDPATNILYGDNAQGKTNILEAAYLCGTTKSHRGSRDREIIRFDQEESHIRMMVRRDGISRKIDVHLKKNKSKGIAVDGIPIKKASELFGIVNLVFFSPEDLNIIKNGPGERRRFLDMELCQLDKIYLQDLAGYNQVLNQRNKLLKDISFSPRLADTLDVWDMQLVHYGKKIIGARKRFIGELNGMIRDLHASLTGGRESIYLNYEPNVEEELLEERLAASRDRDLKFKQSSVGPHRDDFCVQVNDIDIRKFGSQGQQRTAALSLKLSELALVKKRIGENPVLLLDDVLSELDSSRQNYLLQSIHQIQTLITCTGLDEFVSNRFEINKIFRVIDGNVFKNNDEK